MVPVLFNYCNHYTDPPVERGRTGQGNNGIYLQRRGRGRRRGQPVREPDRAAGKGDLRRPGHHRHRGFRRAFPRFVPRHERSGAGFGNGRRRHKAETRPVDEQARHDRNRRGRHVRERPAGVGRGAALLSRLHSLREAQRGRVGAGGRRTGRRMPHRRLQPGGRGDGRAPRRDAPDDYDIAGFAVGVVDRPKIIDGKTIRPGDAIIGPPRPASIRTGFRWCEGFFSR